MFNPARSAGRVGQSLWRTGYVFIHREAEIYHENASKDGGWEGTRPFRIVTVKTPRSAVPITSY